MRITNNMMIGTFSRNLNGNLREMGKIQEQLASGRRINRPSDDPIGLTFSLRMHTNISENEQYQKNVSDATSWLENTDTALDEALQTLQRARELAVQGANGTNSTNSLKAIAQEVAQLREHIEAVANTEMSGRYLFSGTKTNVAPYDVGNWQGNSSIISYEIGPGTKLAINVTGDQVFGDSATATAGIDSVFEALDALHADLLAGNNAAVSNQIGEMDIWIEKNLSMRAEVGARTNRLEMAQNRLENGNLNLNTLLNKIENVDSAQAITDLKVQENVYNTSLAIGARIIQPSLVDFLR